MAAREYEFYLRVSKYLSRVSEANEWEILSAREGYFIVYFIDTDEIPT